jgi:hypothetical protein
MHNQSRPLAFADSFIRAELVENVSDFQVDDAIVVNVGPNVMVTGAEHPAVVPAWKSTWLKAGVIKSAGRAAVIKVRRATNLGFNVGQSCNSGSRIIVHEDIAEAFTEQVVSLSQHVTFGDPLDPETQVGAIVTPEHSAKIDGYVQAARAAGARVVLGGGPL